MDLCNFRIGNKIYEKKYGSYGITTLHKKHMKIYKDHINIEFIGKKGVLNNCTIWDPKFIPILKKVYKEAQEDRKKSHYIFDVSMNDINDYLDKFSISSKDMRMWNANMIFLKNLDEELKNDKDLTKKKVVAAIKKTALEMHNTATVCKKSYIYKELFDLESGIKFENRVSYEDILKKILKKNKNYKLCL
jgi:DNA topoisomerase-1